MLGTRVLSIDCPVPIDTRPSATRFVSQQISSLINGTRRAVKNWSSPYQSRQEAFCSVNIWQVNSPVDVGE